MTKNGNKVMLASILVTLAGAGLYYYGWSIQNVHMFGIAMEIMGAGIVGFVVGGIVRLMK